MSIFGNLAMDDSIENETDQLGGGGVWDTDIYDCVVAQAWAGKSDGGAAFVTLHLKNDQGREMRETIYVSSGDAKGNLNYYEKDGQKHYLPGFNMVNALCLLTVGVPLHEVRTEDKTVEIWNSEAKEEVPTQVPVLVDLLNKPIYAAVIRQTVDRQKKGDDGQYHPTGETRDKNTIDKFFDHDSKRTTAEIRAEASESEFFERWAEKNRGNTRNKASKDASQGGTTGSAGFAAGAGEQKPTSSLFAKK